jgi:energy-coupling factor transporter transmembrane protein EcfT
MKRIFQTMFWLIVVFIFLVVKAPYVLLWATVGTLGFVVLLFILVVVLSPFAFLAVVVNAVWDAVQPEPVRRRAVRDSRRQKALERQRLSDKHLDRAKEAYVDGEIDMDELEARTTQALKQRR